MERKNPSIPAKVAIIYVFLQGLDEFKKELNHRNMSIATPSATAPLSLTPGAAQELKKLRDQQEISEDFGLRVGVEGGGCAGMNYILGFDQKKEGDSEYDIDGIRVFMNKAHGLYLAGMEIDFKNGLDARGFVFNNPNAESTCGCGSSFSA